MVHIKNEHGKSVCPAAVFSFLPLLAEQNQGVLEFTLMIRHVKVEIFFLPGPVEVVADGQLFVLWQSLHKGEEVLGLTRAEIRIPCFQRVMLKNIQLLNNLLCPQ